MRIVFMGSSEASSVTLKGILRNPLLKIVGVVTQPDRPSGRSRKLTPCPCKKYATDHKLGPIITPEKVNAPEVVDYIASLKPDVIAVVAFGQFLGKRLLELPRFGCINGHFSLLPKYRGASPVQAAIMAGEPVTGVTIMQMGEGMDDGDILLQKIEPIYSDSFAESLMDNLANLSGVMMAEVLQRLAETGKMPRIPQDNSRATYAPKIRRSDALIDWSAPAVAIARKLRAFDPWPGAFTYMPRKYAKRGYTGRLKILMTAVLNEPTPDYESFQPGAVCAIISGRPVVRTTGRPLQLVAVQPENSNRMDACDFLKGHPLVPGDVFENEPWA